MPSTKKSSSWTNWTPKKTGYLMALVTFAAQAAAFGILFSNITTLPCKSTNISGKNECSVDNSGNWMSLNDPSYFAIMGLLIFCGVAGAALVFVLSTASHQTITNLFQCCYAKEEERKPLTTGAPEASLPEPRTLFTHIFSLKNLTVITLSLIGAFGVYEALSKSLGGNAICISDPNIDEHCIATPGRKYLNLSDFPEFLMIFGIASTFTLAFHSSYQQCKQPKSANDEEAANLSVNNSREQRYSNNRESLMKGLPSKNDKTETPTRRRCVIQ